MSDKLVIRLLATLATVVVVSKVMAAAVADPEPTPSRPPAVTTPSIASARATPRAVASATTTPSPSATPGAEATPSPSERLVVVPTPTPVVVIPTVPPLPTVLPTVLPTPSCLLPPACGDPPALPCVPLPLPTCP